MFLYTFRQFTDILRTFWSITRVSHILNYTRICMYVCMYVCIYVCRYVCILLSSFISCLLTLQYRTNVSVATEQLYSQNTAMSGILQFLLSHNKILSFWHSVTCFMTPCHLAIDTGPLETAKWSHIPVSTILSIFRSMQKCVQFYCETSITNYQATRHQFNQ